MSNPYPSADCDPPEADCNVPDLIELRLSDMTCVTGLWDLEDSYDNVLKILCELIVHMFFLVIKNQ